MLHASQNTIDHLHIATNRSLNSSFHIHHASTPKCQDIRTFVDKLLTHLAHNTQHLSLGLRI
jgi:hypothetical protein